MNTVGVLFRREEGVLYAVKMIKSYSLLHQNRETGEVTLTEESAANLLFDREVQKYYGNGEYVFGFASEEEIPADFEPFRYCLDEETNSLISSGKRLL